MKDKITREEVAQRMQKGWTFNQYPHGGSRSFIEGESGDRHLIIDTYYNSAFAEYMDDCAKNYFAPTMGGNQEDSVLSPIIESYSFLDVQLVLQRYCEQDVPEQELKDFLNNSL